MKPYPWSPHNIVIASVTTSKTVLGQGGNLTINTTIFNYGNNTESFNITVYVNTTVITTCAVVSLVNRTSITITFTWNTTGFAKGNYTISALADIVPSETDTTDIIYAYGKVAVSMVGDVNADGEVNILDITIVAIAFDSNMGDSRYNPNADINNDGIIDVLDISIVAINFEKTAQLP
jgi:hypothetical protein